jgi:2',3'-cyclic-nucleotide 2'-phosphodiesterase (5'-nucleotidase family)
MLLNINEKIDERSLAKSELILRFYQAMGYDAINVGEVDLQADEDSLNGHPFLSSNVRSKGKEPVPFKPSIFKEFDGFRVAIFGLSKPNSFSPQKFFSEDPVESAQRVLDAIQTKADLIICLTNLNPESNRRLAQMTDGIDIIIGGEPQEPLSQPILIKDTLIFYGGIYGQYVGQIELTIRDVKRPFKFSNLYVRSLVLEDLENVERRIQNKLTKDSTQDLWSLSELVAWREKLKNRLGQLQGGNTLNHLLVPLDSRWEDDPDVTLWIEEFKRLRPSNPYSFFLLERIDP